VTGEEVGGSHLFPEAEQENMARFLAQRCRELNRKPQGEQVGYRIEEHESIHDNATLL